MSLEIFPFDPYEIQVELMEQIANAISHYKIGLFESPTGTGKSLSILSATISWVLERNSFPQKTVQNQVKTSENPLPDWVEGFTEEKIKNEPGKFIQNKRIKIVKFEQKKRLILATRTHSQIFQMISELKSLKSKEIKRLRVVAIGSRKTLCINENVTKLKNANEMNLKCLKMIDSGKTNSKKKCPFLKNVEKFESDFDNGLKQLNIEGTKSMGEKNCACPYYGIRSSIPNADVLLMPYSSLLDPSTREKIGLCVKNSVIVIDEAHNLPESLFSIHSSKITDGELRKAMIQIWNYFKKTDKRLGINKSTILKELQLIIEKLERFIAKFQSSKRLKRNDKCYSIVLPSDEFEILCEIENTNFPPLLDFIESTELTRKMMGYLAPEETLENPFQKVISFFETISRDSSGFGRVTVEYPLPKSSKESPFIKFWLLDVSSQIEHLAEESQTLLLFGGTMQPFDHFTRILFPKFNTEKILEYSCGHIVDPRRFQLLPVSKGPNGQKLDFTIKNRFAENSLKELIQIIFNICSVAPKGAVCFFQSYNYMKTVLEKMHKNNSFEKIDLKKKIFMEPGDPTRISSILKEYKETIEESEKGALLMCIYGGKLSEGIDFKDDLARTIVCVGVPFPDLSDGELRERMKFLDARKNGNGRDYYYNLCLRAVNQAIGRSIRWKGDYASVVLLDNRFCCDLKLKKGLSEWILRSLKETKRFGEVIRNLAVFYRQLCEK